MRITKCKYCGSTINFIKSEKGKLVPVDPEPVSITEGNFEALFETRVINDAGKVGSLGSLEFGWALHFNTCIEVRKYSKRRVRA